MGSRLKAEPRVLDLGCGNGRFARFLTQRGVRFTYVGVDASALALDHARPRLAALEAVELFEHDFITGREPLPDALASSTFDLVVLFGVLHHVPGRALRSRLLTEISGRVASGGVLAYTTWRFDQFPRFVKKLVPWEDYLGVSSESLDVGELEPGDHIMTWGVPSVYRYCHAASEEESETLRQELPLRWVESFRADDDLNRYDWLQRD
jgi:SAM-dependent methyltransferase